MVAERECMKFKTRELSLMNLIGVEVELDAETDMFEQVMEVSGDFKSLQPSLKSPIKIYEKIRFSVKTLCFHI